MAILKSLIMRNSRKKIGGIVTYGLKGQTVGREQAAKVTNRRTTAQMSQRVRLANLVQLWKRMSFWAKKGAFQTKLQKESDYNAFVKANIKGTSLAYLTKAQVEAGCSILAPVVISKGSLTPVLTTMNNTEEFFISDINVGEYSGNTGTLGELAQAIIDNNNGIYNGDQISFILGMQMSTSNNPYAVVRAYEYTLDVTDTTPYLGSDVAKWLAINIDADENQVLAHEIDTNEDAGAFVLSRTVNGALQVSNARLVLTDAAETFLATFTSATALNAAIKSYGTQQTDFLIPGDGGQVNPNSGGSTPVPVALTLNSITIDGTTYAAGQSLNNPGNLTGKTISFNFNKSVAGMQLGEVQLEHVNGESDTFENHPTANGSSADLVVTENDGSLISSTYESIRYIQVVVDDGDYRLNVNSTSADPGDVTP